MHVGATGIRLTSILLRHPEAVILPQKHHVKHVADDVPRRAPLLPLHAFDDGPPNIRRNVFRRSEVTSRRESAVDRDLLFGNRFRQRPLRKMLQLHHQIRQLSRFLPRFKRLTDTLRGNKVLEVKHEFRLFGYCRHSFTPNIFQTLGSAAFF